MRGSDHLASRSLLIYPLNFVFFRIIIIRTFMNSEFIAYCQVSSHLIQVVKNSHLPHQFSFEEKKWKIGVQELIFKQNLKRFIAQCVILYKSYKPLILHTNHTSSSRVLFKGHHIHTNSAHYINLKCWAIPSFLKHMFSVESVIYLQDYRLSGIGLYTTNIRSFNGCRSFSCDIVPWIPGQYDKIC